MEYELIIRPEARADLLDAFYWYQNQRSGLGYDFKLCVDEVISKIQRNPLTNKVIEDGIRRSVTRRFPYGIFYLVANHKIIVLAVLHSRQNPTKWKTRI
jgi:plasmid stabilization system protein ParE